MRFCLEAQSTIFEYAAFHRRLLEQRIWKKSRFFTAGGHVEIYLANRFDPVRIDAWGIKRTGVESKMYFLKF